MAPATIHPALRDGVCQVVADLRHEGVPEDEAACLVVVAEAGRRLAARVENGAVRAAWHHGAEEPGERAVLELLCRRAIGAPIQDVAEHAIADALEELLNRGRPQPVAGILTPLNAGPPFRVPLVLARRLWLAYRQRTGAAPAENTFERPWRDHWLALTSTEKKAQIAALTAAYAKAAGFDPGDVVVSTLDDQDRVFVALAPAVPQTARPELLMRLEAHIRRGIGERIEVLAEDAKDANRIRRL